MATFDKITEQSSLYDDLEKTSTAMLLQNINLEAFSKCGVFVERPDLGFEFL